MNASHQNVCSGGFDTMGREKQNTQGTFMFIHLFETVVSYRNHVDLYINSHNFHLAALEKASWLAQEIRKK